MKEEIFRMERVTYAEQGVTKLEDFNLQIYAGEVMGLLPVNAHGLPAFLKLLETNLPLYDGYVYYGGEMINSWRESSKTNNRISIIQAQSCLVNGMTVADNIFVLRQGFRQRIIHASLLGRQLEPFMQDIGMDISADQRVENLSAFERVVVEILRAVVMGHRLIVLDEISTFVSEKEMEKLYEIIGRYTKKGFSFLYISTHFEEILEICSKAAFLSNGRLQKIIRKPDMNQQTLQDCLRGYDKNFWIYPEKRHIRKESGKEALVLEHVRCGCIQDFSLIVREGECVMVQALDDQVLQECIALLKGEKKKEAGLVRVDGKEVRISGNRDIAVLSPEPTVSMLFPEMSYMDNLCMGLSQRIPGLWTVGEIRASIEKEYAPLLGSEVFRMPVSELTERQKYQLVYTRIALQKPKAAFLIQPFMGADMPHRRCIWEMTERLLEKGIALIILSLNPLDSILVAERTLRLGQQGIIEVDENTENSKFSYSFML